MSSGFIWATEGKVVLVYVAGFFSWTGYIFAHYAVIGAFVDDMSSDGRNDENTDGDGPDVGFDRPVKWVRIHAGNALAGLRAVIPDDSVRAVGFVAGIAVLVAGIAILAWYVRQGNHLLGNLGSGMFLGGYVIAHYFDSGSLL